MVLFGAVQFVDAAVKMHGVDSMFDMLYFIQDDMITKRRFNFNPKPVSKHFEDLKFFARSKVALETLVKSHNKLKKVVKKIFSKKGLTIAATGTIVGVGVTSIWNYIESNSGCFKKRADGSICKVREFSCCEKSKLDNVNFCDGLEKMANVCDNFDEEKEKSCCRLCECEHADCLPNETMQCQRPTVADALNHFASQVGSTVWSGIGAVFPWISYVIYGIIAIVSFWILNTIRVWIKNKNVREIGNVSFTG